MIEKIVVVTCRSFFIQLIVRSAADERNADNEISRMMRQLQFQTKRAQTIISKIILHLPLKCDAEFAWWCLSHVYFPIKTSTGCFQCIILLVHPTHTLSS